MSVISQLDELEDRLETISDALKDEDYDTAQQKAQTLGGVMDCPMCENLEHAILGGVMFAIGVPAEGQKRRALLVREEIERFRKNELEDARERIQALDVDDSTTEA